MVEITGNVLCLYAAEIDTDGETYSIEVPTRELEIGGVDPAESYRVALLDQDHEEPTSNGAHSTRDVHRQEGQPPVSEGDVIDVEIETLGDQGDGIAKIGPGYVVIVEGSDVGERLTVRITDAQTNVAFAEIVKRYE